MLVISEDLAKSLVTPEVAFEAVETVFAGMYRADAYNFPVIREAIGYADALYGFKSGFDRAGKALGLKSGGYWPGNMAKGLTNHQSTVVLFDPDTGRPSALVGGNYLTAVRTAASSAISVKYLSRPDSAVLGMIGAGHQAAFQMRAAAAQRDFQKVVAWNYHPEMLDNLAAAAADIGLPFEKASREDVGAQSDVIITITSSFEPQMMKDWVKPGAHLACMGTDTKGKQEVDPALLAAATVYTDEIAQSVSIGEAQHAVGSDLISNADITPIGAVIDGAKPGRIDAAEITLFDGTGVGLQDLAVAAAAVKIAGERGVGLSVDF